VRKRIAIAVLVIVGVAVLVYVVSQPKKGSVEWHKREYRVAMDHWMGRSFSERARQLYAKVFGVPGRERAIAEFHRKARIVDRHQRALIRLGYLEEQMFIASNTPVANLSAAIDVVARKTVTNHDFFVVALSGSNGIKVVNIKGNLPPQEEVWRVIDLAPQKTER
jgi:hypothetical protein